MKDRRGKFKISLDVINENPWLVLKVMAKVIIVRAECMFMLDAIEYQGYSPEFAKVPEALETPEYAIEVETLKDGDGYIVDYGIKFPEGM